MPEHRLVLLAVLLAALATGCAVSDAPGRAGANPAPSLTLADSTVLHEPDSLPIGRWAEVSRDARGRIFLSDVEGRRILRFAPTGEFERTIGRQGSGPGEFRTVEMLHLLPDGSRGVVVDGGNGRLALVDLDSGSVSTAARIGFRGAGKLWQVRNDTVFFSLPLSPVPFARWRIGDDSAAGFGELPAALAAAFPTYARYGVPEVMPRGDGFVALLPAVPGLVRLDREGRIAGQVPLPARHRRGTPGDLVERHQELEARQQPFAYLGSLAAALGPLSTGEIAVLHADLETPAGPDGRPDIRPTYYLTIVSRDLRRACLDAPVPFTSDSPTPVPHFAGDTLLALARRIGAGDSVRTVLYRYAVSSAGCRWVVLESG